MLLMQSYCLFLRMARLSRLFFYKRSFTLISHSLLTTYPECTISYSPSRQSKFSSIPRDSLISYVVMRSPCSYDCLAGCLKRLAREKSAMILDLANIIQFLQYSQPQLIFQCYFPLKGPHLICMLPLFQNDEVQYRKCQMVFKTLRIYIKLVQLQLNSQQQSMEGATVALFWGSILAQYLWFQKEYLYNETKRVVQSAAQSVWNRSTDKMKNASQSKTSTSEQVPDKQVAIPESQSMIMKQLQEEKNQVNKQKKIKKTKTKQPKNLRKTIKKYEDWFLQSRNIRKMTKKIQNSTADRQDVSLQFKRESCDFNDNMKNYNVEQLYEEYCDENEAQFSNGDILGYNPVVSDVEEEAGSRHGNSFTKSR